MKQVLRKSIIRHIFRDQKPLIAFTAISNQVSQSPVPQLPNTLCLLHERLRVGPREFRELLDGDPRAALEAALEDEVRGLLAALGDDEVAAEAAGGGFQVGDGEPGGGKIRSNP